MNLKVGNNLFLYLLNRAVAVAECNRDKIEKVSCVPEPALNWDVNQGCLRIWGMGEGKTRKRTWSGKDLDVFKKQKGDQCVWRREPEVGEKDECGERGTSQSIHGNGEQFGQCPGYFKESGEMKEFSVLKDHSGCFVENGSWGYRCN